MTLTEGFAVNEIFIDFGAEILYGDDQANMTCPMRFPTVNFRLMATNGLVQIADRIRKEAGFKPMHAMDEYTDDTCDNFGWYDFSIGINGYTDTHLDSAIDFIVVESDSEDNEQIYSIELTVDEQIAIYNRLNVQCLKYEGKSCEVLLAEARKEMEAT